MYSVILKNIKDLYVPDQAHSRSLYLDLYNALKSGIESGQISANAPLPPSRLLAEYLNLSRSTVIKAYNLLEDALLISARQGSGYFVSEKLVKDTSVFTPPLDAQYADISEAGKAFMSSANLLVESKAETVAFTPGIPPVDLFPIGQWQKLTNQYWRNIRSADLNYAVSSGLEVLRSHIADYLNLTRKLKCHPEQVIIVSGSLQSLYLIGNVLLDKGDCVVHENPTFPNVISIFKSLQAHIHPVAVDQDGLMVDQLATHEGNKIKLVHTCPSNAYPIGGRMTIERRKALLNWASEQKAYIIENDYEHEINNWHKHTPSIFSLDTEGRTIFLGTFNRLMHPSIRLGYMVVPTHLLPAIKALQAHSHRFVPQSIQAVMTDFIHQNHIYKHVRTVVDEARIRKQIFLELFNKQLGSQLPIQPNPTESFHLLASFEGNDLELAAAIERRGVVVHPLSKCYVSDHVNGIIMGYSSVNKGFIPQFINKMAGAFK